MCLVIVKCLLNGRESPKVKGTRVASNDLVNQIWILLGRSLYHKIIPTMNSSLFPVSYNEPYANYLTCCRFQGGLGSRRTFQAHGHPFDALNLTLENPQPNFQNDRDMTSTQGHMIANGYMESVDDLVVLIELDE